MPLKLMKIVCLHVTQAGLSLSAKCWDYRCLHLVAFMF